MPANHSSFSSRSTATVADSSRRLPVSLIIVALLFCLFGVGAGLTSLAAITAGIWDPLFLLPDVLFTLCLPIGIGLLRASRGARTWALTYTWFFLIAVPLSVLVTLSAPQLSRTGPAWPIGVIEVMLLIWIYRVLTRSDVRELFLGLSSQSIKAAEENRERPIHEWKRRSEQSFRDQETATLGIPSSDSNARQDESSRREADSLDAQLDDVIDAVAREASRRHA